MLEDICWYVIKSKSEFLRDRAQAFTKKTADAFIGNNQTTAIKMYRYDKENKFVENWYHIWICTNQIAFIRELRKKYTTTKLGYVPSFNQGVCFYDC
jgi:hypothetical protein